MTSEVVVVAVEAFAAQGARRVLQALGAALDGSGSASLALAGGSTPLPVYRRLAAADLRSAIDWSRVEIFWGDERGVPRTHPASNYRAAREWLLRPLGLGGERVHPVATELGAAAAAVAYEREIRRVLPGDPPRFDLVLLGVGDDGHTASLFPGPADDAETEQGGARPLVVATRSPLPPTERVSFDYPLLAAARKVLFLVRGGAKAAIVWRLFGEREPACGGGEAAATDGPPAARVAADDVTWLLDETAAASVVGAGTDEPGGSETPA